jgi:hypothetical protein
VGVQASGSKDRVQLCRGHDLEPHRCGRSRPRIKPGREGEESFLICKGASNNLHLFGRGQLFLVGVGGFSCPFKIHAAPPRPPYSRVGALHWQPIPFPWLPVHPHGRSASATASIRPRIRPGQPHRGILVLLHLVPITVRG